MDGLDDDLIIFKQKIDDLTAKEQGLQKEKITVLEDVNIVERKKVKLVDELEGVNKDLATYVRRLG